MYLFLLAFCVNFPIITDLMLGKLKIFDLAMSNFCVATSLPSLSWYVSSITLFFHLLAPLCSGPCMLAWRGSVVHILNSSCHMLDISAACVPSCSICTCYEFLFCLLLFNQMNCSFTLPFFTDSNSWFPFVASFSTLWDLCASSVLAHANTCSLVTSFVFLIAFNYYITSVTI